VYRNNRAGPRGDERFHQHFVEVEGVGANIAEDGLGPTQHERIDGGNKSERWNYHLVAGLNTQQEGGHLQRMGTRRGQQHLWHPEQVFQQRMAAFGERAIPRQVPEGGSLLKRTPGRWVTAAVD
jgi:hypothetical protein